jgi:predicted GNAT family acetyltransferase
VAGGAYRDLQDMSLTIRDNVEASRYEAFEEGARVGLVQYRRTPDKISFIHTETADEAQGRGVGSRLVAQALAEARAAGLMVLPFCPFVRRYVADHPEYLDLVPESRRGAFGLPEG